MSCVHFSYIIKVVQASLDREHSSLSHPNLDQELKELKLERVAMRPQHANDKYPRGTALRDGDTHLVEFSDALQSTVPLSVSWVLYCAPLLSYGIQNGVDLKESQIFYLEETAESWEDLRIAVFHIPEIARILST